MRKILLGAFAILNLIVLLWAAMTAGGAETQPRMLTTVDNPKPTVEAFITSLSERDFDKCMDYVSNYGSLGDAVVSGSDQPIGSSDRITEYLYEQLLASYQVTFLDESNVRPVSGKVIESDYTVSGRDATVTFEFTVFDTVKFSQRLSQIVTDIASQRKFEGFEYDSDEKAYELIEQSFQKILEEPAENFLTTAVITVNLVYVDKAWKINIDDRFYDALMGDLRGYESYVSDSDVVSNSDEGGAE